MVNGIMSLDCIKVNKLLIYIFLDKLILLFIYVVLLRICVGGWFCIVCVELFGYVSACCYLC